MENNREFCFTIMPSKGYFNDYYLKIYKLAIQEAELHPLRADDIYTPGKIINDIWDSIQKSKIVLADLTQQNANVFYELGLAHASGKPVILISETIDDIPFDLRALRIILYDKNVPDWGTLLKENVVRALKETIATPLKSILPTFLTIIKDKNSFVSESDKLILELKSDIESLKQSQESLQPFNYDQSITPTELEILKFLSEGKSQSEISDELFISISSVEKILNRLKIKFQANNNIHLIKIASNVGMIP